MGQFQAPQPSRLGCWFRRLCPDHNALRRASDRAEAAVVAALAAALLAGVPLAALSTAWWSYNVGVRAQRAQMSWRQVPAVLLTNVGPGSSPLRRVLATWTAPGGAQQTGPVPAPASARAGTVLRVWIDASGRPTDPPLQHGQVIRQAALASLLASIGLGLVLLGVGALAQRVLDHRRLAAWDAEWQAIGPQWSTRH